MNHFYSCNTPKGKSIRGKNIIKANDICVYNYGFDMVGDSHIIRLLLWSVAHKIASKSKDNLNINLFSSNDYGYYKCLNWDNLKEIFPFDKTKMPVRSFDVNVNNKKAMDCQKLFNSEILGCELNKYGEFVNNSEPIFDYISTKENLGGCLNNFKLFKMI